MHREFNHASNLVLFARVVQAGGISKCAAEMGLERTTVSRRLKELERQLGATLLKRSPRQNNVTAAGRRCFRQCVRLLEIIDTVSLVSRVHAGPDEQDVILIGSTPEIVSNFLEPHLAEFERDHPGVKLRRRLFSGPAGTGRDLVDLIVTWDTGAPAGGNAWRLAMVEQAVYASPDFLADHGTPANPSELVALPCVVDYSNDDVSNWAFSRQGLETHVKVHARHVAQGIPDARESAIAGFGICRIPMYLGEPFVQYGQLVRLFPGLDGERRSLLAITRQSSVNRPLVTLL